MIRALSTALALCLVPIAATAQTGGAAAPDLTASQGSQGPMIVERIHNGFLVAPDFKITEVDRKSSGLAGGYAGFVIDDSFFVVGGAYALATNTRDREMAYGGLVLQWFGRTNERFGFSAKTLIGGGTSESSSTVQVLDRGTSRAGACGSGRISSSPSRKWTRSSASRNTCGSPRAPATDSPDPAAAAATTSSTGTIARA